MNPCAWYLHLAVHLYQARRDRNYQVGADPELGFRQARSQEFFALDVDFSAVFIPCGPREFSIPMQITRIRARTYDDCIGVLAAWFYVQIQVLYLQAQARPFKLCLP